MKVFEAIELLEALDPNREVTLSIGGKAKIVPNKNGAPSYFNGYGYPVWVDRTWPPYNVISCKGNSTVH